MAAVVVADGPVPARGRSWLALAVGDAVMCLCLADMWLHAAGVAARDFGRIACGEECFLVSAAASVASVTAEFTVEAFCATGVLFFRRMEDPDSEIEKSGSSRARSHALFSLLTIAAVGDLLKDHSPVKGSVMEQTGIVLNVVGILGKDALSCFIFFPIVALRLGRVTRPGWRCSAGAENENP